MRFTPFVVLLLPLAAWGAGPRLHLVAGPAGSLLRGRAVNVRLGQPVRICAVLRKGRRVFADVDGSVVLRGRRQRRLRPTAELGPLRWRWWRVEPRPHHVETDPPNPGNPAYSNAVLFGPRHGAWLGYDKIEYQETEIPGAGESCITVDRTHPSHPKVDVNGGLGTMRYKATLDLGGSTLASPGMESLTRGGISPRVLRVTFRSGDGLTGYLRGYFNVPNVFGSAGAGRTHQAELYQGADCADVIIGAARELGARMRYTSAQGLARYARPTSARLLMTKEGIFELDDDGKPGKRVRLSFASDVEPGDIMLIDYVGFDGSPRSWDHVAVIDRDKGTVPGELDPQDPVLHMGYLYGLTEEPAATQAPAVIQLLRIKASVLRRRAITGEIARFPPEPK